MAADGRMIAAELEARGAPLVLGDAFGTADPARVAGIVSAFCAEHLGAAVDRYELFAGGVGTVHGVRLADGRRVALKAHRAGAPLEYLRGVQRVQSALADAGMPAPRPLLPPAPIANGVAMVEELLDAGAPTPAHDPAQRARMAANLHRFATLATPHRTVLGAYHGFLPLAGDGPFPRPHDRRFDFTVPGGEWIDELARRAHARFDAWEGPLVVGHSDWRVENLRYADGELSAIYDWDSLVVRPEAAMAGAIAGIFTADWRDPDRCGLPTRAEMIAFVSDYEAARGRPFSAAERELADAALVYQLAYGARCEWSDLLTGMGSRPPGPPPAELPRGGSLARLAELAGQPGRRPRVSHHSSP
jgi:aminoglycoside phosphotransferase (APT) family kinase protein